MNITIATCLHHLDSKTVDFASPSFERQSEKSFRFSTNLMETDLSPMLKSQEKIGQKTFMEFVSVFKDVKKRVQMIKQFFVLVLPDLFAQNVLVSVSCSRREIGTRYHL